jgi:hypothetical protein
VQPPKAPPLKAAALERSNIVNERRIDEMNPTSNAAPAKETTGQPSNANLKTEKVANQRVRALAERLEEGAAQLAAFAGQVSEAEWLQPVSATDRRTIGVIIHHVATMYPIEVDVARAVGAGNAVTDVTWEAVAELNARHARENAAVTKAEALELLSRNSREAAAAVRAFTDEELDRAAAFSLSFGAPMTAQFVIEDHALRHSWHHLARIRKLLAR